MKYPAFNPQLPFGWSYVITRVTTVTNGHLVIYETHGPLRLQRIDEYRVAFVDLEGVTRWDMITQTERVEKIKRVVIRQPRVKIRVA